MFAKFMQFDTRSKMNIVFLFFRYWRLYHYWDMCNACCWWYAWSGNVAMRVDKSIDETILFIHLGEKCLFKGFSAVIVMPICDSTCSTTVVVVTHSMVLLLCCFHTHRLIKSCVFNKKKRKRGFICFPQVDLRNNLCWDCTNCFWDAFTSLSLSFSKFG